MNADAIELIFFRNNRTGSHAVSIDDCITIVAPSGRRLALDENLWDEIDDDANLTEVQSAKLLDIIAERADRCARDTKWAEVDERVAAERRAYWNSAEGRALTAGIARLNRDLGRLLRSM